MALDPLAEALAPLHRVLVPHLPGYGKSPPLECPYSIARVGSLLEEALASRGVSECSIVGFSGGAYRALALALGATALRVTSLVTLAGLAGYDEDVRAAFRMTARMLRNGADLRPMWLSRMTAPGFARKFPHHVAEVMAWLDAASHEVLAAEMDAFADAEDLRPKLASLQIPITARVGALDAATPPSFSAAIVQSVRNGHLQVVPGCGHALLYEDLPATVQAVQAAIAG